MSKGRRLPHQGPEPGRVHARPQHRSEQCDLSRDLPLPAQIQLEDVRIMTMIAPALLLRYGARPGTYNFDQDWKAAKVLDLISGGPRRRVRQARYHPHRNAGACDATADDDLRRSTRMAFPSPTGETRPSRTVLVRGAILLRPCLCGGDALRRTDDVRVPAPSCDVVVVAEQPVVSACSAVAAMPRPDRRFPPVCGGGLCATGHREAPGRRASGHR